MLDRYTYGLVERVSPEASVPVMVFESEMCSLGGAGNVAGNIASLGARVVMIGVLGGGSRVCAGARFRRLHCGDSTRI